MRLDATVTDAAHDHVVHVFDPVVAPRDDPGEAVSTLRDRIFIAVNDHLSPVLGAFADRRFPDLEAYRLFTTAMQHFAVGLDARTWELADQALERDPDFSRLRIWRLILASGEDFDLLDQELARRGDQLTPNQLHYLQAARARNEGNWERCFSHLKTLHEREPDNPMLTWFAMVRANQTRRFAYNADLVESLDADAPRVNGMLIHAAEAYHMLGRHEDELETARRWEALEPDSLEPRRVHARALVALGRLDALEPLVNEALMMHRTAGSAGEFMISVSASLNAHGHPDAARVMAGRAVEWFATSDLEVRGTPICESCRGMALLRAGRLAEARALFGDLVAAEPDDRLALEGLGLCAARLGERETALETAARLQETSSRNPRRFLASWSRAKIAAQLGDRAEALRLLREAISLGFDDFGLMHSDPDLEPLWHDPEFEELLRPRG